jgi:hypothetical protein
MNLKKHIDPDEILQDVGDEALEKEISDDVREANFGTLNDDNANFQDLESDLDFS